MYSRLFGEFVGDLTGHWIAGNYGGTLSMGTSSMGPLQ